MKIISRIVEIIIVCSVCTPSFAQMKKDSINRKMEKLDIDRFNLLKSNNKTADTLKDGSIVNYIENSEVIQETIKDPNNVYQTHKQYFKDNLMLKRVESQFLGMPIGVVKEFDQFGKLLREIDYDSIFKFSIDDLSKLMLQNYQVNVLSDKNFGIIRQVKDIEKPYYEIHIYSGPLIRVIYLDGITGEIISDGHTTIKK